MWTQHPSAIVADVRTPQIDTETSQMLPVPPIRLNRRRTLRDWVKKVDSYTLWAFNPQKPLGR
jgi:hypothetical protein